MYIYNYMCVCYIEQAFCFKMTYISNITISLVDGYIKDSALDSVRSVLCW